MYFLSPIFMLSFQTNNRGEVNYQALIQELLEREGWLKNKEYEEDDEKKD